MSQPTIIVKRTPAHSEAYDERKLYASIYASCLSVRSPIGAAEITAEKVCRDLQKWVDRKKEVTSADIRRIAWGHLALYYPDAAYMYKHSRRML